MRWHDGEHFRAPQRIIDSWKSPIVERRRLVYKSIDFEGRIQASSSLSFRMMLNTVIISSLFLAVSVAGAAVEQVL